MQLLNSNVALISNCEVSRLLAEEAQYLDQQDEVFGNVDKSLRAFQSKVSHYLQPFEKLPDSAVQAFLQSVPSYGLTAAELLNILNIRPKSYCHLCTIVEESEERLSGKKLDSLLHLCQKHLTLEGEAVAPAGLPLEGLQVPSEVAWQSTAQNGAMAAPVPLEVMEELDGDLMFGGAEDCDDALGDGGND